MSEAGSVAIQHQLNANYYLNTASFTLLFYDYLLTLPLETARFWPAASRHRVSAVNVLFFVNRYGTLFGNIPVVMQYFWTGRPSAVKLSVCISLHTYHQYFAVVTQIIIGIMLILRTYALYERNRRVLTLMVCVAAAVIAVGAWAVLAPTHVPEDAPRISLYIGCFSAVNESQTTRLAIAWGAGTSAAAGGQGERTGRSAFTRRIDILWCDTAVNDLQHSDLCTCRPCHPGPAHDLHQRHFLDHDLPPDAQPPRPGTREHVRPRRQYLADTDVHGPRLGGYVFHARGRRTARSTLGSDA
ncbi:hypothetical protein MIND_01237800 [Mycena indigotica]|uniref:DUF6533 domain-containing protein n=1 Tax=Mycena indigotica TaxID=2126181 RepID=A0A8H6VU76_9AGAR|nr:uncharacterized protein MIND_01237800 [Mycena indigotica]KAF7292111.1 hypothetical protein MIND_01237800 [Mycena indigotica]